MVRAVIINQGPRDAVEVVQCYLVPPPERLDAPRATLVDFTRVSIAGGANAMIEFRVASDAFKQVDNHGQRVWMPGRYEIVVGAASPGPRARALGAPAPVGREIWLK